MKRSFLFILLLIVPFFSNLFAGVDDYNFPTDISQGQPGVTGTVQPVNYNNQLYVFFQGADNCKQLQFRIKDEGSETWSRYYRIPNTSLNGSPSPVVYRGELYVFHNNGNNDEQLQYNKLTGGSWSSTVTISGVKMDESPSAVVYKDKLYVFHTGTNERLYYVVFDGNKWSGENEVPNTKLYYSPNAKVFKDRIYVFHRDNATLKKNLWVNAFDGSKWRGDRQATVDLKSKYTPGVAVYNNKFYVFHADNSDKKELWYATYDGENGWTNDKRLTQFKITDGPTPFVVGDNLRVFFNSGWNEHDIKSFYMHKDASVTNSIILQTFSFEKDGYLDKPIGSFTFPGTHNSYITTEDFNKPNRNSARNIIWQLDQGIRCVEIDVNYAYFPYNVNVEKDVAVIHGKIYGSGLFFGQMDVSKALNQLVGWLKDHPKEFIILKVDSPSGVSEEDLLYFYKKYGLYDRIYMTKRDWTQVTPREIIDAGKQVVMMDACGASVKSNIEDYMSRSASWGTTDPTKLNTKQGDVKKPLYYPGIYGTEDPFGFGSHSLDQIMNQYDNFMQYVIDGWRKSTKRPFCVVFDYSSYGQPIEVITALNQDFNSVKGVVYDENGKEMKDVTYDCVYEYKGNKVSAYGIGHFDFPARKGETITVKPRVSGKKFSPESITYTNSDQKDFAQDFHAVTSNLKDGALKSSLEMDANYHQEPYPNPSSEEVFFDVNLTQKDNLHLELYRLNGQLLDHKLFNNLSEGVNKLNYDYPSGVEGGVYLYKITGHAYSKAGKLLKRE